MLNVDDNIVEIKKYLKKLISSLSTELVFSWGDAKFIKKKRIDDLLCCIEATIPQEYKNYIQRTGAKKLQSAKAWNDLNVALKNKFFLNSDIYIIRSKEVVSLIQVLQKTFEPDLKFIFGDQSGMMF